VDSRVVYEAQCSMLAACNVEMGGPKGGTKVVDNLHVTHLLSVYFLVEEDESLPLIGSLHENICISNHNAGSSLARPLGMCNRSVHLPRTTSLTNSSKTSKRINVFFDSAYRRGEGNGFLVAV